MVRYRSGLLRAFFSRRRFARMQVNIPGVVHGSRSAAKTGYRLTLFLSGSMSVKRLNKALEALLIFVPIIWDKASVI